MKFDVELETKDIQSLNNADAIAGFFSRLGYDTNKRVELKPDILEITSPQTRSLINRIELIADQEKLFQVYLFEMKKITLSHTRTLIRAFKNSGSNYLLILTSDYEFIDFVLIEKYLSDKIKSVDATGMQHISLRPRSITVDRRNPSTVHLRVLRRFTYTESDPISQNIKLLSAYTIADWSEDYFNNRALFSDYYLKNRLPQESEWKLDIKKKYFQLIDIYRKSLGKFHRISRDDLRNEFILPVLESLGFKPVENHKSSNDYPFLELGNPTDGTVLTICQFYNWERDLDRKDDVKDKDTPDDIPGIKIVSYLEGQESDWAILTNGKLWRLYSKKAHSRSTNYYEVDLYEILSQNTPSSTNISDSFRYFWLLFNREAFIKKPFIREGKQREATFLDKLINESQDYATKLGERLKEKVFEHVFPLISKGFVQNISEMGKETVLTQEQLNRVFQGTLTLLYRLLFILYAESRDLLPVKEIRGYYEVSLDKLKNEIKSIAGNIADDTQHKISLNYKKNIFSIYYRLINLFSIIDKGDSSLNVPYYNGGLFITEPSDNPKDLESWNAVFLNKYKIADYYLAQAIDSLARDIDSKRQDLVFIDYKSLGVRQLGSIYEGLLEFKLRIAEEKMAVYKEDNTEKVISYQQAQKDNKRIVKIGRGKDSMEKIITKGEIYLENDKHERKSSGSYYTPDCIVKYIVKNAISPVLESKFNEMRSLLREAQNQYKRFPKEQEEFVKKGMRPKPKEQADLIGRELPDILFDIKILDPAMGSGHFLVETVDFITDKTLEFLNGFPWNPIFVQLDKTRQTILSETEEQGLEIDSNKLTDVNLLKRLILKRCIYGVDLNPMAVELSKISLWLDCFTLGAPLSFLDHHLKCGNSLIGSRLDEVREKVEGTGDQMLLLGGNKFAGLMLATDLMMRIGFLSDVTGNQVKQSREEYKRALDTLAPFKTILDVYTSQWFGNEIVKFGKGKKEIIQNIIVDFLKSEELETWIKKPVNIDILSDHNKKIAERTLIACDEKNFFHWELEFPEVFFGPRKGTTQVIDKLANPGFDAIIGNPPYNVIKENKYLKLSEAKGTKNLFGHFIARSIFLNKNNSSLGLVVPLSFSCGNNYEILRQKIYSKYKNLTSSHFSIRPAKLFDNVDQRITIFIANGESQNGCMVESSRLYRFYKDERENLVLNPEFGSVGLIKKGYIPRIANSIGASIYKKFLSIPKTLNDFINTNSPYKWWMHSVGRYWLTAYTYTPFFKKNGYERISTKLREISSIDKKSSILSVAIINSDLFYFWWILQSDEFDLLISELSSMPFPLTLLEEANVDSLVNDLMESYKKNAVRKTLNIEGSIVEMDEIHARYSRPIILKIDELLAPHYGLTSSELQFLQEYDVKFRTNKLE